MKYLNKYLEIVQRKESIFPMDSIHKRKKILRTAYPEQEQVNINEKKERVMIDFDGVIHNYNNGWQNGKIYGQLIPGAKEVIDQLKNEGYEIVIFTTRASKKYNESPSSEELIRDLENWLQKNGIYYDMITAEKLGAKAYIDDRAIKFTSWEDVKKELL